MVGGSADTPQAESPQVVPPVIDDTEVLLAEKAAEQAATPTPPPAPVIDDAAILQAAEDARRAEEEQVVLSQPVAPARNDNDDDNTPSHQEILERHGQTEAQKEASDVGFGSDTGGWTPPGFDFGQDNNDSGGGGNDDSGGGGGGGSDDNCVVATYALEQGVDIGRKEAVKWCVANLHDHWAGETVRRGYQYLGRKKIAEGKGHEHFEEFKNYIDFATGNKRNLKNGWTFVSRTLQFFITGLVRR